MRSILQFIISIALRCCVLFSVFATVGCAGKLKIHDNTPARDISSLIKVEQKVDFTVYRFKTELQPLITYDVSLDGNYVWLGTNQGLVRYNWKKDIWNMFGRPEGLPGDFAYEVNAREGKVVAEVLTIPKPGHASRVGHFDLNPVTLIWTPTRQGILEPEALMLRSDYKCVASYGTYNTETNDFQGGNVLCSTVPGGTDKHRYDVKDGLSHSYCFRLATEGKKLWVSHWDEDRGLSMLDFTTNQWSVVKQNAEGLPLGGRDLVFDGKFLWIGQSGGVVKLNPETNEAVLYSAKQYDLPGYWVSGIAANDDSVWVAITEVSDNCRKSGIIRFKKN